MNSFRTPRILTPALSLVVGACFATRTDVRVLQGDIQTLRVESARSDSARRRQVDAVSAQVATNLGVMNDSLRGLAARAALNQGESRGEFRQIRELLIQLQELVGQSQATLMKLRADNELRAFQQQPVPVAPAPTVPTDTTGGAVVRPIVPATIQVGPNQLWQGGLDQARRGNYAAAQAAFEELLSAHPTSELAPDALYFLADAYEADGKYAQSDSAYLRMVVQHVRAPRAPTALYKYGQSLAKRGRRAEARAAMERVTKEYPVSDAADLAREWLMRNR